MEGPAIAVMLFSLGFGYKNAQITQYTLEQDFK